MDNWFEKLFQGPYAFDAGSLERLTNHPAVYLIVDARGLMLDVEYTNQLKTAIQRYVEFSTKPRYCFWITTCAEYLSKEGADVLRRHFHPADAWSEFFQEEARKNFQGPFDFTLEEMASLPRTSGTVLVFDGAQRVLLVKFLPELHRNLREFAATQPADARWFWYANTRAFRHPDAADQLLAQLAQNGRFGGE